MERTVNTVIPAQRVIDDGDMLLWRALPHHQRASIGPYVFVDHYRHQGPRGIGDRPHPHAGIEVISYLFSGGVEHRDSLGGKGSLKAGDAQYIRAGRGIIHAEQPTGGRHGLQLWTSLPARDKLAEPLYRDYPASSLTGFEQDGIQVRVLAGSVQDRQGRRHQGPMTTATRNLLAVAELPANGRIELTIDTESAEELGLYVAAGSLKLANGQNLSADAIALLGDGEQVVLQAGEAGATVALIGGEAVRDPLIFDGPFVMDTPERIAQAYADYRTGKMGHLV